MKIRVERDGLADAVAWVARSLPSRPPVPVLGGILLDASSDGLTISGFDYEVSATVGVAATIADGGRTLVSGRLLADITRALPAQPVEISVDGSRVSIACGSAKFSLPTMPVEDYPQLPAMPPLAGELAGEVFGQAVSQVAVAAGKDDTLPMLTGVRVEIDGEKVTLVATDRFRLAMREFTWKPDANLSGAGELAVLVPARTLAEAAKALGTSGATVELALAPGDGLIGLSGSGRRTTSRLLDTEFPRYRQLLPSEQTAAAIIDVGPLAEAIKRVSLVAERGTQVRLEFDDGGLRLSAGGDDEGSAEEELQVEYTGDPVTIAFNPAFLQEGLGALHADRAELSFTTPSRPALIKPVGDDGIVVPGYLHLLMPVRLPG